MKSKKKSKLNGFEAMGLSSTILRALREQKYNNPHPIQKMIIPPALEGRDIVGMARTGSGKTAAFLIPLLEKLKERSAKPGARAFILSPTRDLARQTFIFFKKLAKYTGLRAAFIAGNESMDNQYDLLVKEKPDVIIAVPGRFLQLAINMDNEYKFDNIQYVVLDEADRLFEMGSDYEIQEIINRLPETRQTLLISATLPKVLTDFVRVGLTNPYLAKLELKLPDNLTMRFVLCRTDEKIAVLLHLLKFVIKNDSPTFVFAASHQHVEYLNMILEKANISNAMIYGAMHPTAREISLAKFKNKIVKVLVTTDASARGIDIPLLDNVINFHFPHKPKDFVHRAGRCARNDRAGTAYSIVSGDEHAHLLDVKNFLNLTLESTTTIDTSNNEVKATIGTLPQSLIDEQVSEILRWHKECADLENMSNVCKNSYQKVMRTRKIATSESCKNGKKLNLTSAGIIAELCPTTSTTTENIDILSQMKNYRPSGTIFEIGKKSASVGYIVMKAKRQLHSKSINKYKEQENEFKESIKQEKELSSKRGKLEESTEQDIEQIFGDNISFKKRKMNDLFKAPKKVKRENLKDDEFYIPYAATDKNIEEGLAISSSSANELMNNKNLPAQSKKWDRKKKKMVTVNNNSKAGKIRTESGVWIPASYKTDSFKRWKEKSKIGDTNDSSDDEQESSKFQNLKTGPKTHWARHNQKLKDKVKTKQELKRPEQILKQRKLAEKKQARSGKKGKGKKKSKGKGGK
ncbi:ATP-dependent RNA helicase DDX54 [Aphidius gifuensis]|nr:ATP-dependent RNA helicase DDX54 [Aphidius gifuensis]